MDKRTTLLISFTGVVFFTLSLFSTQLGICNINSSCVFIFDPIAETLLVFVTLFFLSLLTYSIRDETYKIWFRFSRIWVPLTVLLVLITPEYSNSLIPIEKGAVSFIFSILFLLISLIIIITKSLSSKK